VKRVLNVALTPFAVGLKDTLRWYTKHAAERKQDYSFEDKLIRSRGSITRDPLDNL